MKVIVVLLDSSYYRSCRKQCFQRRDENMLQVLLASSAVMKKWQSEGAIKVSNSLFCWCRSVSSPITVNISLAGRETHGYYYGSKNSLEVFKRFYLDESLWLQVTRRRTNPQKIRIAVQ
jgi:hypothetical protein